jgi:PAT family beta-lactamase induction signal transducer AmpG
MANPLYITLGYGKAEIATIVKLFGIWVGIAGGFVVAAYGFPTFFAMTAAVGIPVVALCFAVGRIPQRTAPEEAVTEAPVEAAPDTAPGNPTGPVGLASAEASPEISPKAARAQT